MIIVITEIKIIFTTKMKSLNDYSFIYSSAYVSKQVQTQHFLIKVSNLLRSFFYLI